MATSIKQKLRGLTGLSSTPEFQMHPVKAFTVTQSPDKGGGSVHVAAISADAYRVVISGGQYPSSFAITKHDAAALVAILLAIETA